MRPILTLLLTLLAVAAHAGVYRWVDAQGRVQFSDRPMAGAEPVPLPAARVEPAPEAAAAPQAGSGDTGPYTTFEVVTPEPNATLRDAEGKVQISLLLEPSLAEGHRLRVLVNGQSPEGDGQGTQMVIQGLSFGSHRLQAEVLDELGVPVAYTAPVDFHLRKPLPETALP
jgi:hypothetical protein